MAGPITSVAVVSSFLLRGVCCLRFEGDKDVTDVVVVDDGAGADAAAAGTATAGGGMAAGGDDTDIEGRLAILARTEED